MYSNLSGRRPWGDRLGAEQCGVSPAPVSRSSKAWSCGAWRGKQLEYDVEGQFDTMGCSGGPVVDESGRLAAINVGHLNDQNVPGKMRLTCIAAPDVLEAIKLPSDVHPVTDRPAPPAVAAVPAGAQDATNQKADAALRHARLLLDNRVYAKAREQLQAIISGYPTSDAAKKPVRCSPKFQTNKKRSSWQRGPGPTLRRE